MKSTLVILILTVTSNVLGCWIAPPDFVVLEGASKDYFIRKDNLQGKIEVRHAKDFSEYWSVKIDGYNSIFSKIELSREGDYLIHIFGNHMVRELDQSCVQIFDNKGLRFSYSLKEFIDDLATIETDQGSSITPKYNWFKKVNFVTEERFGFELSDGRNVVVSIIEKKIIMIK